MCIPSSNIYFSNVRQQSRENDMRVLGIWDGHDSGAALVENGVLVAAVNEERFSRRKLEICFPARSIATCLRLGSVAASDIDVVAASTTDVAKTIERWLPNTKERYYAIRRRQVAPTVLNRMTTRLKYRITEWGPTRTSRILSRVALKQHLRPIGFDDIQLDLHDHHTCHALAAAHASGMTSCVAVTVDGLGDGLSATISRFEQGRLERVVASPATASLGVFFEHVTHLLNMRELEDEGKVMALADLAAPIADDANPLLPLLRVHNGRIHTPYRQQALLARLKQVYWTYPSEQFAFMAQRTVEHICTRLAHDAVRLTGIPRVVTAGGVASNIKANQRIRCLPEVDDLYVFPHMGDGGLAVGAAYATAFQDGGSPSTGLPTVALGPAFSLEEMTAALRDAGLPATPTDEIASRTANLLLDNRIVLWFQGRMEYGPRALGQRSVLARPDRPFLRDRLNRVLKRRSLYQPFCPSVLEEEASTAFLDWSGPSNPFMTMSYTVSPEARALFAGVLAPDHSCRPHIVSETDTSPFAEMLRTLRRDIGVGAVLNTSFNIHGEPMVCTPHEAVDVFLRCGADALALGPFLVTQENH